VTRPRYKALLLDFYGTLVHEPAELDASIAQRVAASSPRARGAHEIRAHWVERFVARRAAAHGSRFETQRAIERASLSDTLRHFDSPLDADELVAPIFAYWSAPLPIADAAEFVRSLGVPVCIVSNIDTEYLVAALSSLGWSFAEVVTSEGCRAYKPRAEPFRAGLARLGCAAESALHVGDSLGSDVLGAAELGIPVAWVTPDGRAPRSNARPSHVVSHVSELAEVLA
jgi:2-haloacid dehalogenase/putative hydrolase of the HAD superfamily